MASNGARPTHGPRSVSADGRRALPATAPRPRRRDWIARAAVLRLLERVEGGHIELVERWSGERIDLGPPGAELSASATLNSPRVYTALLRGSVGLGEAYAAMLWDTDDLVSLLRIGARDIGRADPLRRRTARLVRPAQRVRDLGLRNDRRGARRNIAAHYDLGNELFQLFLDREAMMYSAAVFERADQTLEEAQLVKLERICQGLELEAGDHLLEIGTGWGGLAVHAASRYGCRVTTTTISREQRAFAQARVRDAGLDGLVDVVGHDYRDLRGSYDKLVSIEMIEAVGWQYFDTFFRRCSELLEPDGLFFLQAITVDDRGYEAEKSSRSFATELIFPGGCLPSLEVIQRCVSRNTDMRTVSVDDISASYALTLRHWRERFVAATERLKALGYDRRFRRLWEMWLAISEAGFREARIADLQMVLAKPRRRVGQPASAVRTDRPASVGRTIG